ncbi:tumor necrosis factor-like [Hemiscyllium ocellatum]|uniref:tumor necrosis factor-like n=1 Tax=Hemiscyllium ocellatum TaxID=170820 RepID=UPI002965F072|nr:tumor necrosis factor-like [Hemiscyllium ocellatum]
MKTEAKFLELENGGLLPIRESGSNTSCFWRAVCALAVLGLLLLSTSLLLLQFGVLPTNQETLNSTPVPGQKMESYSAVTGLPVRNGLPQLLQQVGSDPRPRIAAHLTALQTKGGAVIWQNESDSTFAEGLEFRDNRLIIKRPGQYFVYTQVVFHSMECQPQAVYLSHELTKLSPNYPEEAILLKATKSACHSHQRKEPWYKTSYQGAIFEFLEGDQIFSRVDEETTGYVDTTEGKTFFGIFAV